MQCGVLGIGPNLHPVDFHGIELVSLTVDPVAILIHQISRCVIIFPILFDGLVSTVQSLASQGSQPLHILSQQIAQRPAGIQIRGQAILPQAQQLVDRGIDGQGVSIGHLEREGVVRICRSHGDLSGAKGVRNGLIQSACKCLDIGFTILRCHLAHFDLLGLPVKGDGKGLVPEILCCGYAFGHGFVSIQPDAA